MRRGSSNGGAALLWRPDTSPERQDNGRNSEVSEPSSPMRRIPSHALLDFAQDVLVPQQVNLQTGSADMQYSFGFHSLQGEREKMEDRVIIQDLSNMEQLQPCRRAVFMAVLDGHAGSDAVDLLVAHLLPVLLGWSGLRQQPLEALKHALMTCEEELMQIHCSSGSTALLALMLDGDLYLANVGDSRAVVCDDGEARQLTRDHKPTSNELERARLEQAGASFSIDGYLQLTSANCECSDLMVSRALGGAHLKQSPSFVGFETAVIAAGRAAGSWDAIAAALRQGTSSSNEGSASGDGLEIGNGGTGLSVAARPAALSTQQLTTTCSGTLISPRVHSPTPRPVSGGGAQPLGLPPRGVSPRYAPPAACGTHLPALRRTAAPLSPPQAASRMSEVGLPSASAAAVPALATANGSDSGHLNGLGGGPGSPDLPSCHSSASSLDEPLTRGPSASITGAVSSGVVIPDPDLFHYAVTQDSEFLILACDGLWDHVRNSECTRLVRRWIADGKTAAEAAELLSQSAIRLGSTDNVTTIVLRFSSRPISTARPSNSVLRISSVAPQQRPPAAADAAHPAFASAVVLGTQRDAQTHAEMHQGLRGRVV